jgi:hypothetical protein
MEAVEDAGQDAVACVSNAVAEVGDGFKHADLALVENTDAVGETFRGLQDLGCIEDRATPGGCGTGLGLEERKSPRIHAGGEGFIEEPELGIDDQQGEQGHLVRLASGEGLHRGFGKVEQVEGAEPVDDAFRDIRSVGAVDAEDKSEASEDGLRGEVGREIRQEHHPPSQFQIPDREGATVVSHFPLIGSDQPREAAKEGGLAGSIGTQDCDDLPRGEAEADAVEGADPTIGLVDGRQFDVHRQGLNRETAFGSTDYRDGTSRRAHLELTPGSNGAASASKGLG